MQHINENIEDLFRKAAENYPLDTDSANWDEVAARLNTPHSTVPVTGETKRRKILFSFFLLLLIVPSVCYVYHNAGKNNLSVTKSLNKTVQKESLHTNANNGIDQNLAKEDIHQGSSPNSVLTNIGNQKPAAENFHYTDGISSDGKNLSNNRVQQSLTTPSQDFSDLAANNSQIDDLSNSVPNTSKEQAVASSPGNSNNSLPAISITGADKSVSPMQPDLSDASNKKSPILLKTKSPRFYIGISAAPQLSFVKLQSIQKPGLRYGVIGGYNISNKWALELGILRNQQYFYTSVNYFSTSDLNFKPTTTINGIDGYNYITEFPLSVRYTFPASKKQSQYFVKAGVSSQIINSEKYWYQLNKDNRKDTTILKLYDRNGKLKAFSDLQFSAGYEVPVFKKFANLRIEPYCKIPVSGVGIGNVRVTEFGINVGITKYFK